MEKIAILIKTFEREEYLYNCINSIKKYLNSVKYKIYICDDGPKSNQKKSFYDKLKNEGHFILELPYNVGANPGRLAILPYISENIILRMDDDFYFCEDTRIDKMLMLLTKDETAGAVVGLEKQLSNNKGVKTGELRIKDSHGKLKKIGSVLIKCFMDYKKESYNTIDNIKYCTIDYGRNFILMKKSLLEYIVWDYCLKFAGEHLDFMLQLKKCKKYKLLFTPESIHLHAGPQKKELSESYINIRYGDNLKKNEKNSNIIFIQKWGIAKIISFHIEDNIFIKLKKITIALIKVL